MAHALAMGSTVDEPATVKEPDGPQTSGAVSGSRTVGAGVGLGLGAIGFGVVAVLGGGAVIGGRAGAGVGVIGSSGKATPPIRSRIPGISLFGGGK